MPSFLGIKSRRAFGQPTFFLAGNRMTIVAFEKEVTGNSFKYRLTGFRINIFKNDFSVHHFVLVYSYK